MTVLEYLILEGESETLEFKSSFDREAIETLAAFANSSGGTLLVGVQDTRGISGVTVGKETIQSWINQVKMATTPAIIPDVTLTAIEGKNVVQLTIAAFPVRPVACRGKYFRRVHGANHAMSLNEVADAYLKTFQLSWDSYEHFGAQLQHIDTYKLELFIAKVNRIERFHLDEEPLHALEKLRLIKNMIPTNASMLLFACKSLPYNIHIGRFADATSIRDDIQITETLPEAFTQAMQAISKHINISFRITGMEREELWEYPQVAIREALANAIVHRDYQNPSDIQIKIFDDRMTIYSSGRLYGNLTVDDLQGDSYHSELRNKLIAEAFYLTGIIEKYGSGLTRIRKAVRDSGAITFSMEESANGFMVTFRKTGSSDRLRFPEMPGVGGTNGGINGGTNGGISSVVKYIELHPGSNGIEITVALHASQRTVERLLKQLKDLDIILFKGPRKTGGYYLVNTSGGGRS